MPHADSLRSRRQGNVRRRRSRASAREFSSTAPVGAGGGIGALAAAPGGHPTAPVASTGPIQPSLLPPTSTQITGDLGEIAGRLKKRRREVSTQLTGLAGLSARGDVTAAQFKAEVRRQRNALAAFTSNPLG